MIDEELPINKAMKDMNHDQRWQHLERMSLRFSFWVLLTQDLSVNQKVILMVLVGLAEEKLKGNAFVTNLFFQPNSFFMDSRILQSQLNMNYSTIIEEIRGLHDKGFVEVQITHRLEYEDVCFVKPTVRYTAMTHEEIKMGLSYLMPYDYSYICRNGK